MSDTILTPSQEAAYEHFDATGQFDAAETRERAGIVADNPTELTSDAIRARLGIASAVETVDDDNSAQKTKLAPGIGSFTCGDCLVDVMPGTSCPPGHITVQQNGKVRING